MKKLLISLAIGSLLTTTFSPAVVSASIYGSDTPTSHSKDFVGGRDEIIGQEDNIVTEIGNDDFVKYQITENNETFDLIFNHEANEVVVDNLVFDMDVYINAINENEGSIKERIVGVIPKTISDSYESHLNGNPQMSPRATLPTTGYGTLYNVGSYKKSSMKLGLATALLTLVASFVFKGNVVLAKSFVTSALKKAVSNGLIAGVADTIVSDVYYVKKQAFHKTVANAVKETRRPYTQIQSSRVYGPTATYYFWSSRPY